MFTAMGFDFISNVHIIDERDEIFLSLWLDQSNFFFKRKESGNRNRYKKIKEKKRDINKGGGRIRTPDYDKYRNFHGK